MIMIDDIHMARPTCACQRIPRAQAGKESIAPPRRPAGGPLWGGHRRDPHDVESSTIIKARARARHDAAARDGPALGSSGRRHAHAHAIVNTHCESHLRPSTSEFESLRLIIKLEARFFEIDLER